MRKAKSLMQILNHFGHWTRVTVFLLGLLLLNRNLSAEQTAGWNVKGYVYDSASGESLPYANVSILGTAYGSVTNTNGYFVIMNIPADLCTLNVSYIGYSSKKVPLRKSDDFSKPLRIELVVKAIDLNQVEVVAQNYKIWEKAEHVSQVTISPRQLDILPNFGEVDIFRSLQLLPGISGISDGSSGLYVRGGTPDQNLVILDGMNVYHVDHFFGIFSAFNADAIKDVQVYKGGFPAKYGGRLSSVVELTGKNGDQNYRQLSLGANLLSANMLFETPVMKNSSWLISARRSYTDLIRTPLYNSLYQFVTGDEGSTTTGQTFGGSFPGGGRMGAFSSEIVPSFYFYDINSKLSLTPTERDFFSISVYAGKDKLDKSQELSGVSIRGADSADLGTREISNLTDWGNLGGSIHWSRQWRDRFCSKVLLSFSNYQSNHQRDLGFTGGNPVGVTDSNRIVGLGTFANDEYNDVKDWSLHLNGEWYLSPKHTLGFGNFSSDVQTSYTAVVLDTFNVLDIVSTSFLSSFYLQDEWKPLTILRLTIGLRGTYYDQTRMFYREPRFSFDLAITKRLKLKGAWGHYYQFINNITNENVLEGSHDFWLTADEHIKPGLAVHNILGISYETPDYLLDIEGYYKILDNLVEFSRRFQNRSDYLQYFFFGSGISQGVEFLVQKKVGRFNGWISYTLGKVEYTFPNLNGGVAFPAEHDRRHELKLIGSYQWKTWNFSATWVYGSGQPYTAPESQYYLDLLDGASQSYIHVGDKNSYRLPDYHRLDVSVSRRFATLSYNWDVGISIFNLYNHKNVYYRTYDLETVPIVVSDVVMLGFTPTVFIKLNLK